MVAIALGFLNVVDTSFTKEQFTEFCKAFQEHTPLKFHEIGALVPSLELLLLETIAAHGKAAVSAPISARLERAAALYTHLPLRVTDVMEGRDRVAAAV